MEVRSSCAPPPRNNGPPRNSAGASASARQERRRLGRRARLAIECPPILKAGTDRNGHRPVHACRVTYRRGLGTELFAKLTLPDQVSQHQDEGGPVRVAPAPAPPLHPT